MPAVFLRNSLAVIVVVVAVAGGLYTCRGHGLDEEAHDAAFDRSANQDGAGGSTGGKGGINLDVAKECMPGEKRSCLNALGCPATDSCTALGAWEGFACGGSCGARCDWSLAIYGCTWSFAAPEGGISIEYNRINVEYMPADGGRPVVLYNVGNVGCDGLPEEALGWDYILDEAGTGQKIALCADTCKALGPAALLAVVMGCSLP
jgi:hypothetical protein